MTSKLISCLGVWEKCIHREILDHLHQCSKIVAKRRKDNFRWPLIKIQVTGDREKVKWFITRRHQLHFAVGCAQFASIYTTSFIHSSSSLDRWECSFISFFPLAVNEVTYLRMKMRRKHYLHTHTVKVKLESSFECEMTVLDVIRNEQSTLLHVLMNRKDACS